VADATVSAVQSATQKPPEPPSATVTPPNPPQP